MGRLNESPTRPTPLAFEEAEPAFRASACDPLAAQLIETQRLLRESEARRAELERENAEFRALFLSWEPARDRDAILLDVPPRRRPRGGGLALRSGRSGTNAHPASLA